MAHWFEDLTKQMADDKIGRRTALHRVAGAVAGVIATSAMPTLALAKQGTHCECVQTCSSDCPYHCIPNPNCWCWLDITGKSVCGCNSYCSQIPTCSKPSDCKKGFVCIVSTGCNCGTSQGVCVPACKGKHINCQLGEGHGMTATGRVV